MLQLQGKFVILRQTQNPRCNFGFIGRQFEGVCSQTPDPAAVPAAGFDFCAVHESRVGGHSIILGAEIDMLHPDTHEYVEIKTTKCDPGLPAETATSSQLLLPSHQQKIWVQSFWGHVNKLVLGVDTDPTRGRGLITVVHEWDRDQALTGVSAAWKSDTLHHCVWVLDWVRKCLEQEAIEEHEVYWLEQDTRQDGACELTLSRLDPRHAFVTRDVQELLK